MASPVAKRTAVVTDWVRMGRETNLARYLENVSVGWRDVLMK
jgi:hypothetical protein